ncbi:polyadenylate-binding protein [Coprinopsis cinerea AmutBmut pab1-1]|nr:polyadenylate-binding protein [Coprinopsis cinerea AmutBmut pab1-1]
MDADYSAAGPPSQEEHSPQPHPYLHEPLLYITNLPAFVTDEMLAVAFMYCGPFRPKIQRNTPSGTLSGTIEFKFLEKAEKALATLHNRPIPEVPQNVILVLSPYPPTNPPTPLPPPSALPRLVKQLPQGYTDSQLYDLFRPYGALASARTQTPFGPDTGMVEFWNENDARTAEEALHCAEVEGQNIAVQIYQQPRRTSASFSEFNPSAAAFVPSGSFFSPPPYAGQYSPHSPPRGSPYRSPLGSPYLNKSPLPFVHGPGQQVQFAPAGASSHSGLIDPCNLFCKNLDPDIDSNSLFTHFRRFGQIVSARVMRNEQGESRGFGFVSFQTPEQASAALHAMNGAQLGSKQIVVRLHEPKQLRQEKLAHRFGHNGHPRSASGATSPTISEAGDYHPGWGSPRGHPSGLASPSSKHLSERTDRARRGSGSYYNAARSGTLNLPMKYDELAALTPVVRKEVLTGELSRRITEMNIVPSNEINDIVEGIANLTLSVVVQTLENPDKLREQVELRAKNLTVPRETPGKSASPVSTSQESSTSDLNAANATASAPEHPSTPISVSATLSTPPRTSSPSGSVPPMSERERIFAAVNKFENTRQNELTELLMGLPKRERAMCLFNPEVLRVKLVDAKAILDSEEEEEEQQKQQQAAEPGKASSPVRASEGTNTAVQSPVTPKTKAINKVDDSPTTPDLSSRGPSATASPLPGTPGGPVSSSTTTHTIASLAKLPAAEIVRLANLSSATGLPLPKADPLVVQATDEFIDGLMTQTLLVQKQKLGDKLYKVVKSFGIKGSPKITIALLDSEDLRALAHLMNSYPAVLKEKALNLVAPK